MGLDLVDGQRASLLLLLLVAWTEEQYHCLNVPSASVAAVVVMSQAESPSTSGFGHY